MSSSPHYIYHLPSHNSLSSLGGSVGKEEKLSLFPLTSVVGVRGSHSTSISASSCCAFLYCSGWKTKSCISQYPWKAKVRLGRVGGRWVLYSPISKGPRLASTVLHVRGGAPGPPYPPPDCHRAPCPPLGPTARADGHRPG